MIDLELSDVGGTLLYVLAFVVGVGLSSVALCEMYALPTKWPLLERWRRQIRRSDLQASGWLAVGLSIAAIGALALWVIFSGRVIDLREWFDGW